MNNKSTGIILIIIATIVIHIGSLVVGKFFLQDWRMVHEPLHTALEISGTIIAIMVARILLKLDQIDKGTSFNIPFASALIGMGLLDGVHALYPVGKSFVWFHSIATFLGGLLFVLIYFPQLQTSRSKKLWLNSSISISLGILIIFALAPQMTPEMVQNQEFTLIAKSLNILGGVFLILASLKILRTYFKKPTIDDLLFFMHCLLFGLAATMFQESSLWDLPWWGWHVLRFLAYGTALYFVIKTQNNHEEIVLQKYAQDTNFEVHQQLDYILEAAGIGMWSMDFSKDYMVWDTNMYKLYEKNPSEFDPQNNHWVELLHDEDRDETLANFQRCIDEQKFFDTVFRIKIEDKSFKHIRSKARIEYSSEGIPLKAQGINWDVTEEVNLGQQIKQLYDELKHHQSIIDQSAIVIKCLSNHTISSVNQKFEEVYGYSSEEVIGKTHSIYDSKYHDKTFFQEIFQSISQNKIWTGEICDRSKCGKIIWLSTAIYPNTNENGIVNGYMIVRFDITSQKETQAQLKLSIDQAEKALEIKSTFLSNMSHEIRTPMNGILGASDLLLDSTLEKEQTEYAEMINHSAQSLLVIINDILDYSKIESGKMQIENIPFNYVSTIKECVHLFSNEARTQGISLNCEIDSNLPHTLISDPTRLRQIILNLLSNSIKFTEKGHVVIRVKITSRDSETIWIQTEIEDTGIGMTEKQVEGIFERFTQADSSTSRKFGGTGLGTSISLRLCELLGGNIEVSSKLGQGSIFRFKTPMGISQSSLEELQSQNSKFQFEGQSILLVEDNPTNQKIALKLLNKLNLKVITANNGQEALEVYSQSDAQLILMDIQMPIMDGIEACKKLRAMDVKIPIIALTANVMEEEIKTYLKAGMNSHLSKPFQKKSIELELSQHLSHKQFTSS